MPFRFRCQNLTLELEREEWKAVFETAQKFGWTPAGTVVPEVEAVDDPLITFRHSYEEGLSDAQKRPVPWDGHYFSREYQEITERDALELSKALGRAVRWAEAHEDAPIDFPLSSVHAAHLFFRGGRTLME